MKIRIHYTLPNKEEDSLIIEGDTIEELQIIAKNEVEKHNAKDPWSEKSNTIKPIKKHNPCQIGYVTDKQILKSMVELIGKT